MMGRSVILSAEASVLALALLATPAWGESFVWVVTNPEYGRALYGVQPDGTGELLLLWEPSGLPPGAVFGMVDIRGNQVVFDDGEPPIGGTMYRGTVGSDEVIDIVPPSGYLDSNPGRPKWIPGQDRILFSNFASGIHKMDVDPATDDEEVLTTQYFDEVEGIRSDTLEVIFSNAMYRPGARIFTMDLNGDNVQGHDPFPDSSFGRCPVLSPDNSSVLVTRTDHLGAWLVDADTWQLISPIEDPLIPGIPDAGENNGWFAWSSDSQTIAYVDNGNLYSINIDGSDHQLLARGVEGVYGTYIPEPGALALLGVGTLLIRRR